MKIPFLDLVKPHVELEPELTSLFAQTLHSASFVGGPLVADFEAGFAAFCECAHAVAVGSGTDALRFALMAAGVGPGKVVLTVPNTFIATVEAISQAGAIVEFVDVDEETANISIASLRKYCNEECLRNSSGRLISKRNNLPIAAIVPVHLYGQMAEMDALLELAAEYDVAVVEDACQAHGAEYFSQRDHRWHRAGSMGQAAGFSFYPGKNLGACGEAGAVTTNHGPVAAHAAMLRDHGQSKKYYHDIEGYNGRMDALQAGILSIKLKQLDGWNQARRNHAALYRKLFSSAAGVRCFAAPENQRSSYHLFVIRVAQRDALIDVLAAEGIGTGIHYPIPLHLQKAYRALGYCSGSFPVAERLAGEILSLPMYPQLETNHIESVASIVCNFAGGLQ